MTRRQRTRTLGFAVAVSLIAVGSILTACAGAQTTNPHARASAKSSASSANSDPSVDAASQHRADGWVGGAVVPSGAIRSSTQLPGIANGTNVGMWCEPMAHAVGYWALPRMSAADTRAWLVSHPSDDMTVTTGDPTPGSDPDAGGTVIEQPSDGSLEALIFTVTPRTSGAGVRLDAFAMTADSVCATAPGGSQHGIGG